MALAVDFALVVLGGEVGGDREARLALDDLGCVRGCGDAIAHLREDGGEKGVMRMVGPGDPCEGLGRSDELCLLQPAWLLLLSGGESSAR